MKLREVMESHQIDLNDGQVRAFFLGSFSGVKPLDFPKALTELLGNDTPVTSELKSTLEEQWMSIQKKYANELADLLDPSKAPRAFLPEAQERLDFFLTGLSLAGAVRGEALEEVSEELENLVMDLDDLLTEGISSDQRAEELKEDIIGAWEEFVKLKLGGN